MAIKYVDPVNGNDVNDGSSFALRKKTIGSASSVAAAGDTIRVMGSPDLTSLGQTATWTDKSATVTLTTALTVNIALCDSTWTASTNVTCTTSSSRKQGSLSASIAVGSAFTTGLAAYFNTGTLDLSGYQQVSFWIQANAAVAAGVMALRLSTTTAGTTATHDFTINRALNTGQWTCITIDNAGPLNSAIASVALVAISDPGTVTFLVDNVLACKASSSADSLTLSSLIGKNDGEWWAIQSINATAIKLDCGTNSDASTTLKGYSGTTGLFNTYKRESYATPSVASAGANVNALATSGTAGNPITISGGWNTTDMSTQTLNATYLDGMDGFGRAIATVNKSYNTISNMGFCRYRDGLLIDGDNTVLTNIVVSGSNATGLTVDNTVARKIQVTNLVITASLSNGITASNNVATFNVFTNITVKGCNSTAITIGGLSERWFNVVSSNNNGAGFDISGQGWCEYYNVVSKDNTFGIRAVTNVSSKMVYGLTTSGNSSAGVSYTGPGPSLVLVNANVTDTTKYTVNAAGTNAQTDACILVQYSGGVNTTHLEVYPNATVQSDVSTVHAATGFSWKFSPTNAILDSLRPLSKRIATVPIKAGTTATISVWCRRDNTGITQTLRICGGRIPGVGSAGSDLTASNSAAANTWSKVSLPAVTPTVDGVVEVYNECYGGTTNNCWTHELEVA